MLTDNTTPRTFNLSPIHDCRNCGGAGAWELCAGCKRPADSAFCKCDPEATETEVEVCTECNGGAS